MFEVSIAESPTDNFEDDDSVDNTVGREENSVGREENSSNKSGK